jgi:TonB family protein
MSISKISIMVMVMVLALTAFACQVSAQNDRNAKPPADTSDFVDVDEMPVPIKLINAKYPEAAIKAKLEGTVRIKALVNKLGRVDSIVVVKPNPALAELEKAAIEAAKQSEFKPAVKDGKPIAVWVTYPIKFVLTAKSKK